MALQEFLPSKKLTYMAGALVLAGGLIVGASLLGSAKTNDTGSLVLDDIITQVAEIDTDSDGLKDWEEGIRGSDARNPDTDGDGTLDGDEVASGRNPTIAGPDDKATTTPNALDVTETTYGTNESATEGISKEFIARYLTLKAEGRLDELSQAELLTGLAASVKLERTVKVRKEGDFAVVSDSPDNLRAYGNGIVEATARHAEYASYLALLNAIGLSLDTDGVKGSDAFAATKADYRAMLDEYLKLGVPRMVASDHLEYLNLFERAVAPIPDIERVAVDPVRAIVALQQYQENLSFATLMLKKIGAKIDPDGILFTKDEPGYRLRYLQSVP